jgi:hypothetical protein
MALEKKITVEVGEEELEFNVNLAAHDKYINELSMKDKIKPAVNFLMATIAPENKLALKALFKTIPGASLDLAASVFEEYKPDFDISIKK